MARSRKAGELIREEVKLDMTPIIDVVFNLLIFFMCSVRFKTLEGKLVSYLPTDRGLSAVQREVPREDVEIILKVPQDQWDRKPLEREVIFLRSGSSEPFGRLTGVATDPSQPLAARLTFVPADTLDRIRRYLAGVRQTVPDIKAKINAPSRVAQLPVVTILNLMIEAGFQSVSYSGGPATLVRDLEAGEVR